MPLEVLDDAMVLAARKMAWVYIAIAAFENSVRAFIQERLFGEEGGRLVEYRHLLPAFVRGGSSDGPTRNKFDGTEHGGTSPLAYVQLEDLAAIIQTNHPLFKDLVPTVEWAREIFRMLARSRNVIMHSGQLTLADVERVGMNIRDWTRQVGG